MVVFFLIALLATVAGICGTTGSMADYRTYVCVNLSLVGFVFVITGAVLFFDSSPEEDSIGHHHGSIGIIILVVSLFLACIEGLAVFADVDSEMQQSREYKAIFIIALLQKLCQGMIYCFRLRHRQSSRKCPTATKWYFQILSLMNFILWEGSILTAHQDDEYLHAAYGKWISIWKTLYNAFLIDYRLMCCLVFLEHSVEVKDQENISSDQAVTTAGNEQLEAENADSSDRSVLQSQSTPVTPPKCYARFSKAQLTFIGCLIGLFGLAIQVPNGLQYFRYVHPGFNLTPIAADVLFFTGRGYLSQSE